MCIRDRQSADHPVSPDKAGESDCHCLQYGERAGVGCGQRGDGNSGDGRDCPRCGGSRACHQKSEDRRDWNGGNHSKPHVF